MKNPTGRSGTSAPTSAPIPGEPAALLLGALLTVGVAVLCGSLSARAGLVEVPP